MDANKSWIIGNTIEKLCSVAAGLLIGIAALLPVPYGCKGTASRSAWLSNLGLKITT